MYVGKEEAAEELLNKPLDKIFPDKTALNILMRSKGDKKPFEHVPRIFVTPPQQPSQSWSLSCNTYNINTWKINFPPSQGGLIRICFYPPHF